MNRMKLKIVACSIVALWQEYLRRHPAYRINPYLRERNMKGRYFKDVKSNGWMDGFDPRGNIKVFLAGNRPDTLGPALMRPGHLDRKAEFSLPDLEGRTHIFKIHARSMSVESDIRFELLARLCLNSNAAEMRSVCTEAGMFAIRGPGSPGLTQAGLHLVLSYQIHLSSPVITQCKKLFLFCLTSNISQIVFRRSKSLGLNSRGTQYP